MDDPTIELEAQRPPKPKKRTLQNRYTEACSADSANAGLVADLRERARIVQKIYNKTMGYWVDLSTDKDTLWAHALLRIGGNYKVAFIPTGFIVWGLDYWHQEKVAGTVHTIPPTYLTKDLGVMLKLVREKAKREKVNRDRERLVNLAKENALRALTADYNKAKAAIENDRIATKWDTSVTTTRAETLPDMPHTRTKR